MSDWHFPFWNKGPSSSGQQAAEPRRRLRVQFVYAEDAANHPLTKGIAPANASAGPDGGIAAAAAALVPIVVSLATKAAVSLLDFVAARTQPEATTIETTAPVGGFYRKDGSIALAGGYLVFHNGDDDAGTHASLLAVLLVSVSGDGSAFRLTVKEWKHTQFLSSHTVQAAQVDDERDIALKIEFLSPGSSGFGNRTVFIEQVYPAVELKQLRSLLEVGHEFAWFAAPVRPALGTAELQVPFNLRVTFVETTIANKFATWVQAAIKDNKDKLGTLVGTLVHDALDPGAAAEDRVKLTVAAGTAFDAYKVAWDDVSKAAASPPVEDPATSQALTDKWKAELAVKRQLLLSRQTIAQSAFSAAGIGWPGNLPVSTA